MSWKYALTKISTKPDEFDIIYSDEHVVIILDKYPKASQHYLMIPRKRIDYPSNLTVEDLPLLYHMLEISKKYDDHRYLIGFHRNPSLVQLHCHIIDRGLSKCKSRDTGKFLNMITIQSKIADLETNT